MCDLGVRIPRKLQTLPRIRKHRTILVCLTFLTSLQHTRISPSKPTMADAANQRAAAEELSRGDHVEWGAPIRGGKATGEVVEVVTQDTDVKSNHFKASEDNPKVKVRSEKSGKEAVHKPTSVHKV